MISRYTLPQSVVAGIFSLENQYKLWIKFYRAHIMVLSRVGIMSVPSEEVISRRLTALLDKSFYDVAEYERKAGHDVVGFLNWLEEKLDDPASRFIHYGLTSSDVVDTIFSVRLIQAMSHIQTRINLIRDQVANKAMSTQHIWGIGRTHGMWAEPQQFSKKFEVLFHELCRHQSRIKHTLDEMSFGKLSGTLGTNRFTPKDLETKVLNEFALKRLEGCTQIIPRDVYVPVINTLVGISNTIERFCTEIRHLQRDEVGEVGEGFGVTQAGSSAMPHKTNPITSENLCGLARVMRGYLIPAHESVALWHERDISHSSVERVVYSDAFILLEYMLEKFENLIKNLQINEEAITRNLDKAGSLAFTSNALHFLVMEGFQRSEAYKIVQELAFRAKKERLCFKTLFVNDSRVLSKVKGSILHIFSINV